MTTGRLTAESRVFDAFGDLFLLLDDGGTLLEWNAAVPEVTGRSASALAPTALPDLFDDGDAERVLAAVEGALDADTASFEASLRGADGERSPYEFELCRLPGDDDAALAGIGRDVSERVERRARLERREALLRDLYEITADPDRPFTEQIEALLALGRAELDTAFGTLSRIEGDEYLFEVVDAADDSIRAGDTVPLSATNCEIAAETEQTLVLGDVARDAPEETDRAGYREWGIACYIGAPVMVDGEVYGTFCFYDTEPRRGQFSDWEVTLVDLMSRWVSYEVERRRANDRLERQNEKLEQFATLVSHDLRNPLNVVEAAIALTEETGDLEQLRRAEDAVGRMNTLIDDLLTLARAGAAIDETEPVRLDELVDECWATVRTPSATLAVDTGLTVQADRTRLRQLFENLFRNAIQHAGEDVTVTVGDLPDGDGFYVADDGPGFPDADRDRVFESGYTTSTDGTGFGLTIVEEIADAHGWDVRATAGTDGGARFEFTTGTN